MRAGQVLLRALSTPAIVSNLRGLHDWLGLHLKQRITTWTLSHRQRDISSLRVRAG